MELTEQGPQYTLPNKVFLLMLFGAALLHVGVIMSLQWSKAPKFTRPANKLQITFSTPIQPSSPTATPEPKPIQTEAVAQDPVSISQPEQKSKQQVGSTQPKQQSEPLPATVSEPAKTTVTSNQVVTSSSQDLSEPAQVVVGQLLGSISKEYQHISDNQYHDFTNPAPQQPLNFDSKLFDLKLPQRLKEGSVETYTDVNGQPAYRMVFNGKPICVKKHEFSFHDSFTPNVWVARGC